MGENTILWIIVYSFLGLLAFIKPWFVHETRKLIDWIDAFITITSIFAILLYYLNLQIREAVAQTCQLIQDMVLGYGLPFFYLITANVSRSLQFGEFSTKTLMRIIIYFLIAIFLLGFRIGSIC